MKAKDKKAIEVINAKIEALKAREDEIGNYWDEIYEKGDMDVYRREVEKLSEEWEAIDGKIEEHRREIREIRDKDLYARGYFHEINLARANID